MSPRPVGRRQALGLGAASVAAGAAGWIAGGGRPGPSLRPAATGAELARPAVLDSRGGRLAVELTAAPGVVLAGRDTAALGYNGTSPGPTLRVRPGDELAVRLTNGLDRPTNLHTHGLRVSPQGNGDNPFLRIDPGESFDYLIRIPADHPVGTHWYHPHHHGSVADQVFGGLAGALLVDRGPDLPVADDRVLLVTDITLDPDGEPVEPRPMDRVMGREGALVLVNGQHQPTVPAAPGAAQRWRIVNACVSRVLALRLDGHELVQIALDGTFRPAPAAAERVVLAPGNRADVVVRPTGPGSYRLVTEPFQRGGMGGMGGASAAAEPVVLATMIVSGPAAATPALPARLPMEAPPDATVTGRRETSFEMGMGGGGMSFTVDGRSFDPDRDDQVVAFGAVEEWTVRNPSPLAHPFHLHVWPFVVLDRSDGAPVTGTPQDVVLLPARGWVRIRIPFTALPGRTVYHCHIFDHEDAGMMATVHVR